MTNSLPNSDPLAYTVAFEAHDNPTNDAIVVTATATVAVTVTAPIAGTDTVIVTVPEATVCMTEKSPQSSYSGRFDSHWQID
ncbi:MAG: hypothetical protein GY906_33595 [bacterium]|nr:hypothetical protein [bacterium]